MNAADETKRNVATTDVPTNEVRERARGFDPQDPATAANLHGDLALFRRECPVLHSETHGGFWVVTGYDEIKEAGRHADRFSSAVEGVGAAVIVSELDGVVAPLFELDLSAHAAWRRHLQPFFSSAAAARHEDYIRGLIRQVVDELRPRGHADFVCDLTQRVPPMVVAALLGVPERDRPTLASLARGLAAAPSAEEAELIGREYADFMLDQIRARRGQHGDDLLTSVVNAEFTGRYATDEELLKFALLMVAAGHLTTTDACANTLLVLAQDEKLRHRVAGDLSLIPELIEESVRHESAVAATGRTVLVETELGGVPLSPGDRVLLIWGSANRDKKHFPDGDEFRLGRERGPLPHLGWGAGAHRCLGMHHARLELRVMLEEVLRAIPDFQLAKNVEPERTFGVIRGVRSLPVEWPVTMQHND